MKRKTITDDELQKIVARAVEDGKSADADLANLRTKANEYLQGKMGGAFKKRPNRSGAISNDVLEHVVTVMPQLVQIFAGSDKMVEYTATSSKGVSSVSDAQDLINHEFSGRLRGYHILHDLCLDSLISPASILKVWWDEQPQTEIMYLRDVDAVKLLALEEHGERLGVEILAETQKEGMLYDLKVRKTVDEAGRLRVKVIPPEDYITTGPGFKAHRDILTRSELIEMGFDRKIVKSLPVVGSKVDDDDDSRDVDNYDDDREALDKSTEEIEVFECYMKADIDGDGVAEPLRVYACVSGDDKSTILDWSVWEDDEIFHVCRALPISHKWYGRAPVEVLFEVMEQKTALLRQVLDNIYAQNDRKTFVNYQVITEPAELTSDRIGGIVRVKGNPREAVHQSAPEFFAGAALNALSYLDDVKGGRTGVDRRALGVSPDVLQNQTAEASANQKDAANSIIRFVAGNLAQGGLKSAFEAMLRLTVKHQRGGKEVPRGDDWAMIDAGQIDPRLTAKVNIGLGTGSRERDLAALDAVATKQEQIMGTMGPDNSICGLIEYSRTLNQMVEAARLSNGQGQYFREVKPEDIEQQSQQKDEGPPPELQKMQMEMQLKQQAQQADEQLAQRKLEMEAQKQQQAMAFQRWKASEELQLKRELMEFEAASKINLATQVDIGGEPG